ncbi:MAG TPA: LysR family transcriptional regulator [Pseudomonadales bacterium]
MPLSTQQLSNRLTFRQLQVFLNVYHTKSYSRAGEILGLTQPAVSSQIRQLENALGMPVFEYAGRKLYCTAAGEKLADSVDIIFNEISLLQKNLALQEGKVAGELKLVAVNSAQYVVPYLLSGFLKEHPNVDIQLQVMNRSRTLEQIEEAEDQLAIMGIVPEDRPFISLPFLDNEIIPVAPKAHPFLKQALVKAEDFLASDLLIREPGSGSRLALEIFCQQQRLALRPKMELGSSDSIKHAVLAGLGVAVLPKLSLLTELKLAQLQQVKVEGFPLRRSWCLVYPKRKQPTPAMSAFMDYVRGNLKNIEAIFASQSTTDNAL